MKKIMGVWDLVFMNVSAIIGLRWLPIAAGYGASSIVLWVLAIFLFFIPLSLISTELATTWPEQGGLYVWVKYAFGDKAAFIVSWFYWITNFFYYPALLAFVAVTVAFLINPDLARNKWFVCSIILGCLWFVTLLNCKGLHTSKWLFNIGGLFGIILPGIIIIILAGVAVFIWERPIPTSYSLHHWWPNLGSGSNIVFLSLLMFAMAGMEITPILAGEVKDPQHTFPKSILFSAFFIITLYILGTIALTFMITPGKMGAASGIMDAIYLITSTFHLQFILIATTLMIILGSIGSISAWIVAPIKMLFESTKEGIFPKYFTKLNKNDMPANAMLIQAVIITVIVLSTALLPTVNSFYETLILMATITYFIPYLFMFVTFFKLRKMFPDKIRPYRVPGGKITSWLMGLLGLFSVLLAIILPFISLPHDITTIHDIVIYEIEILGGTILFTVIGFLIYANYERRKKIK